MTQSPSWCERLQAKLMAALDAAWATIEGSDDPVVIRQARDKAKVCGDMAAQARRIAAMIPAPKPARPGSGLAGLIPAPIIDTPPETPPASLEPARALHRLKGGRRGRL